MFRFVLLGKCYDDKNIIINLVINYYYYIHYNLYKIHFMILITSTPHCPWWPCVGQYENPR